MNKTYNIEYEEAPSGHVTFYNYKEPLMKFEQGHGFIGALVFDGTTDKIQCHFCGEWFDQLGNHLAKEHNMKASEYKYIVGLNKTTALINEKIRSKLIASGLQARMKNLRPGTKHSEATKAKIRQTQLENRAEKQNLAGTCPEQLKDRLRNKYIELGHTPSKKRDKGCGFIETGIKVFGSYKNFCNAAGVPHQPSGKVYNHAQKYYKHDMIAYVENFVRVNGRLPRFKDTNKGLWIAIKKIGKKKIFGEALKKDGVYKKIEGYTYRYTKTDLIKYLSAFKKNHGRNPTVSDTKRGLLPSFSNFVYHFGTWKDALINANIQ